MLSRFKKDKTGSLLRAARSGNLEKLIGILNKNVNVNSCDASGLTALHLSAKEGYVAVVKELLKRGAKVDSQTKKKNTPLHISCLSGKLESVKMLVDGGANVNAQSMNGFTPLYMASQEGHVEVVRLLVANRADPNLATDDGFTPLSVALQQGHVEVVRFLMEQSSSSKKHSLSALHVAAKNNDSKALKLLLQNDGVDCNRTTRSGFTPLHIASHYGHVDIGLALLQRKADVNASARNGITPLHVASKRGNLEMAKLLISSGADLDSKTMDGMTPLHCASKSGHHQVIRHLLEKGSKVNPKTKHGLTPLHNASQADSAESCKVLLNNKASINEGTVDDLTPLHVAAHFGNVKSGRLLLEKRCDVDARTKAGFTPLHVAIIKKKPRMVELLLRFGANLDAQTATGLSPMHVAAVTGSSPIASSLLQSGNVNVNSRTSRGDTPLHLATRNNHLDIVGALLHGGAQVDVKGTEHRLTPLHVSSQLGHSESTCLLLKHGSSPDSKTSEMMTPLHLAASKNSLECAAHLLDHGANADVANKSGYTPLHTAIKHNSLEVARLLKDRGVSTEVEGSNGIKPLHVATRYNHLDALQLLLDSGALTNCRAHNGYTPLHVAAQENRINIANLLLAQGTDVNPVSKAKVTPLHLACKEGNDKFAKLLLDKGAHVNSLTSSSLTPMHYAAISGKPEVAELLESSGADVMPRDNNGNTPLHLACYHGKSALAAYLLKHGADPNVTNKLGMTPLHYSAQNGDLPSVNFLLNNGAEPNTLSNDGWSPLCIAQRNGYGELATLLLPLTLDRCLYFPDDLDKGGSDVDGVQSFVFSSPYPRPKVLINLDQVDLEPVKELPTDFDDNDLFELDKLEGMGSVTSLGPGATDDDLKYIRDGEEVCFSSYAGLTSSEIRTKSPLISRPISSLSSRPASPSFNNFLVSFMVDARGGSMYGQRHSGVSVFVPPGCASSPVRVTCRYLAPEKLRNPPPLLPEGEDLACRVIEVGPTGQQFLGPVTLKVPHYASLRDGAREIIIMRSDDGRTWNTHHTPPAQEALAREMDANGILPDDLLDLEKQHVTIVTDKFPVYFALVTRPKRQSENVGSEGGILTSPLNRDVQLVIPQGAVKRDTQVQMQIVDVPEDMVDFEFGGKARVSPIVVIEPKRRKFHTPVTVKIPLPKQKADDDYMVTRLLCSVSGDKATSKWEDITDKTPLNIIKNCAAFLTSISAKYWLVKVKQTSDNWIEKATLVQQGATAVPFLAQFVVLGKRASQREGNFRIFCVTEDRADKIKDAQRNCDFEEITKSQEVEVLQGKPLYLGIDGDLTVARKQQGEPHSLIFHSFRENRLPVRARYTDEFLKAWLERGMTDQAKGRFLFHHTPSHLTPVTQAPVCSLEVYMPEGESGDLMCCNVGVESDSLELRSSANRAEEHISKAELRLTDIADALDTDWIPLALQLGLTPHDVAAIQSDYDFLPEQALVMLHTWVQRYKDKATGNNLEKALKQINREDVLSRCMYNIRQVTDVHEMAVAKEYLDSSLDAPKDYLGSGADVASSRGSSMQRGVSLDRSYGEHASFKDVSLFDSGSESASLLGKDELGKDKVKIGRGSDRFIYMDGSKSPSNLTVTPSESDVEFLPTADVCELDAGVEYELEEIWDGTRWKYVQNVQKKVKDKPQPKDDLKKTEDSTFASLTVEAASPTGRTTPIVDVSDTDLPGTIQNVIVDEPDDEASLGSSSFRGRKAPTVTDVTDSLEVAMSNTETSLASVKEEEQVAEDEDEREKTPIIEVLEDQDYKKTTTDSREEQLDDGTTLRYKTQTVQTVRPVIEKYFSSGRWREERKELIVGEDIQEEVLELAPGVNVEHGTDLESESTVEEFNETLPNGTWVKRKVSRIKVSRKRSPARVITSPWDEAIITTGRKIPITTLPRESYKETDIKMATKVEAVPQTLPGQTHETADHYVSTESMEKVLSGDIIEEPEIVEHEELLPDGTILHYRTITRKLKRPRTRKVVRDGSIIETVTEHELVATTVEDEIMEVSVDAQKLERPETAEKSIVSIEEFEEQMPDKSLLRRKIIRSSLKLQKPAATTTSQTTATTETDLPAKDNLTRSTEYKISEAQFLETTEQVESISTTTTHQTQQAQQTQKIQQVQQSQQTQQVQQTSQTSIREFTEVSKQPDVQQPSKSIESELKHPQQESVTPIPPSKVQQFKVVEKTLEVVGRERIPETQVPSTAEHKVRRVHEEPVAITELSPEEETVNILTPIELPVTPQTVYKVKPSKDHQETSAVPKSDSPVAPKRGATFVHISPVPVMPVGQTTVLSSPSSPTSGPYELPPITETLGVQEWEDIKPDGTRQCFKIVTKRKMRPIAVMRPALDGNGFIEKIIKKEKIGVEIDEEITEIAPNVALDEEDDLDKTTSIDEFHETASDGTWVKRKVRRTEIKKSEDVEEYVSEESVSSAEQEELATEQFYEQEQSLDEKSTTSLTERLEKSEDHRETIRSSESLPVPLPRTKKQEVDSKTWTAQTPSEAAESTSLSSQLHHRPGGLIEETVDPVLGRITVVTFADQPRVDEREETDSTGGTLRYKILTRNFKKRTFKKYDDGSERLIREENFGTEVEEHIEEIEAGLKGDDEVGVERKTSEDEFNETMPDGTWLKRKVSHAKIYRKRREDYTQRLPTPVRSPKIGSKFAHGQAQEQVTEPKFDEREEVTPDGTRLKFKVTSRDHVVRAGSDWKRLGTEITEEIVEISPEVIHDDDEFTDKVTTVSETEDVLEDGTWIKRKIVHVKVAKRRFKADDNRQYEAAAQPVEGETQRAKQPSVQHALPVASKAPEDSEFTEVVNVEEHEELGENGSLVTYKKTTKKCLKPMTEKIVTDGEVVERVSHEVELGTLILEETVEYEPGLVPDFMDYTDEENEKVHVCAVCEESSKLLPDNTWLKKRHVVTKVEWRKDQLGQATLRLDEAPQVVSRQEIKLEAQHQTPAEQMRELSTLTGQIVTSHEKQTFSTTTKTLSSEQVLTTQDVNILERTEPSKSIAAQPSEAESFHTAPGEYKQLIKLPTKAAVEAPVEVKMTCQSMDRKDDQFVEEESVEETDLDEIFDEVSRMKNEKVIQVQRKDDKVQTTTSESDSTTTQSTTTAVTETEIISQSTESKEITVTTSSAEEIFKNVKADHKNTVIVSSPVSALIRPDEAKPIQKQIVDVVAVDRKEKSGQIMVPETSPTELSEPATEKVENISMRCEKDEVPVLGESKILSHDEPAEGKVLQGETAKPQHLEEYTFGVEEEDLENVKQVIEGKILDQSTVERSAEETQPSIKTVDQSLQPKETKDVVHKTEIFEVKNRQEQEEIIVTQAADVFDTTVTKAGNKETLEEFSIEITDSSVLTKTHSRAQTSEVVVDSRSTGDITSSVIQVEVGEPQVVVKSETEESETVTLDKQTTFILEKQETENVTRTEIAEIPLTITEEQTPTSVDSYTTISKSTVTESKHVESVQTTTVESASSEIETSKFEVEKLEIPQVEAKLSKEENLEQIPVALSEQETGTQEKFSESISATDFKIDTRIVEESSIEISSETSVNKVTIEKDTVIVSKPKKSTEFHEITDLTKLEETRLTEATVQSESSVKPSTEMKPQTEERSVEEMVVSDKVAIEVLQEQRVTEEEKLEKAVVLKKQTELSQSVEANKEKQSVERSELTDDSLVSKIVEESTRQVLETKEFAVTKKESEALKVVTVEDTQPKTTSTEPIAGSSTQVPIEKLSEHEAKFDQSMQVVEVKSEITENVETSDVVEEMKVDVSQVESRIELITSELREKETQSKPTTDKTTLPLQQPQAKTEDLQTVDVTKEAEELLTKVEKIHTTKKDVTETPVTFVPQEQEPKVTEESKHTLSTEGPKLEESPAKVELELLEIAEESRTKSESQTSEGTRREDIVPTIKTSKPEMPKTTENQKPEEPEVTEEEKPKKHKDDSLKPVEDLKTEVQDVQTTIQPVPDHSQTEAAEEKGSEQPKAAELGELQIAEKTVEAKDLQKTLEKQEIADQPSSSESTVAEEKIETVKQPTRREISAFRERTTVHPQLQEQSKSGNVEEMTNEELYTSPIDESFAEKLLQFKTPPEITTESLSFGFTPVQEQPETVEKVKEPPKPSAIELPHLDLSSSDVSPTDSEKDFLESLTKEKLKSYEKILMSLEQVMEGRETETKLRAPLALVKAMLYKTRCYSDKESPNEQESLEVETPVEKPQITSAEGLFKKFYSETELNDISVESLLYETKVLPDKEAFHSEPELIKDVTRTAINLAEELSCSILKYFEASGNLLEEKILSVEDDDKEAATKTVDEEDTVLDKQSEEFSEGLTESVVEHFQMDQTIKQEAKDSTTTTSQLQSIEVTTKQTYNSDDQSASMVIIPHAVAEFPVKLVEILKGPSTDDAKDDGAKKIEEEKPGKVVEIKEGDVRTVIEVLENDNEDSTENVITTVTQVEQVKQDVEKTDLTLKDQPPVTTEQVPAESKVDQKITETIVESIEHVVEKGTTIEKHETQEGITVQEVSIAKKFETEFQSELGANVEPQENLKESDKVETVRKDIQQTNVTAETTKVEELTVVSEETFAEESKTEITVVREFTEDSAETVKEVQLKKDTEKDDSIGVVSIESANLTLEKTTPEERKVMERTMKEVKTDEANKKIVEEVELATMRSEEKSAEKSTEKIKSESETQHFEATSTATVEVITEKSDRSEQVKSIDEELCTETKNIKMVSEEVTEEVREESGEDLASSTVIDITKTTISTAVATEASTIDVTTTIVSTTTTTTTSTTVSPSLPTTLVKMEDTASFLKLVGPLSTQQDTSTESKEVLKTESSNTVTLSKTLETEQKLEENQITVQTSMESAPPSSSTTNEEEEGVSFETVEGDVRCKVDESEKYELSEDGKKSITKKVMTRNYYQTHIRNKVRDGVIIAVQPVETFVGKCVDECIFESATDISDPYAADVETTTSIDESEETLDDGTWVKRKTTTVVAYLAHEELDSPSIFLEAVTLPKSPKPAVEEQSQVQKEILESFGFTFPEFFQRTESIDNVKMRIIRLPDSRPKIHESRKSSGSKATRHSTKQAEQQTATSPTSTSKGESRIKREGKPPSFVLPEARSTRTTPPSRTQTDVMSTTSTGSKRLLRSRVRRTITRKIRKVLHSGEVIEDVVTEEIPDVEMSETSSVRSGQSDAFDFMSPMSSSVASIASPSDIASPRRRKGSASSHSSLRVYTDTVEGQPEVTTDVQEREETLPDGRVIVRKVIKTKQKQTIVKRVVLEADEGQPGEADISALIGEDDPSIRMYADSLLQEVDPSRRSTPGTRGQSSYVDEWLQQAVAVSGEAPPATGFEQPSTGPVVVSRVHSAASSKPKYRVSMERTDATTSASSAAEEQSK